MQQQNTRIYPPLQVRAGVLVVDGFGIALRVVNHGKLRVEDGIGRQRRSIVLDRAGCGLERLILIGREGWLSLAWPGSVGSAPPSCRSAAMARCSRTPCRSATTAIRFAVRRPSR